MFRRKEILCEKNSDLRYVNRMWIHPTILFGMKSIIFCVLFAAITDAFPQMKDFFYLRMGQFLNALWEPLPEIARGVKNALVKESANFCNVVMTFATILGAAVIFFYSVQDNKKQGISHRIIISYSAGSFGIPCLFMLTLLLVPGSYIAAAVGAYWTTYMCLFWGYMVEIAIIGLSLLATSSQFSIHVLGNVGIRQFKAMNQLFEKNMQRVKNKSADIDYFYCWTYVPHHMEELMKSDELLSDKLILVRRLLKVPFLEKEIPIYKEISLFDKEKKCLKLHAVKLKKNKISRTYEYYFSNLVAVFNYLKDQDADTRDKLYLILYEFIDEMTEFYNRCSRKYLCQKDRFRKNYLMTVSAIMNAILFSGVTESLMFCQHVLNKISGLEEEQCIDIKQVYTQMLGLYIMYFTNVAMIRGKVDSIIGMDHLSTKNLQLEENDIFYIRAWHIWISYTTMGSKQSNEYLKKALDNKNNYMNYILQI